jgi:hypothetical protein
MSDGIQTTIPNPTPPTALALTIAAEEIVDNTGTLTTNATGGAPAAEGYRQISGLPQTDYQIERVRVAVGAVASPYDTDAGDATNVNPLWVGMLQERRVLEEQAITQGNAQRDGMMMNNRGRRNFAIDRRMGATMRGYR